MTTCNGEQCEICQDDPSCHAAIETLEGNTMKPSHVRELRYLLYARINHHNLKEKQVKQMDPKIPGNKTLRASLLVNIKNERSFVQQLVDFIEDADAQDPPLKPIYYINPNKDDTSGGNDDCK